MPKETNVSSEEASTLLSDLKSLYRTMPSDIREAVKLCLASACAAKTPTRSLRQSA